MTFSKSFVTMRWILIWNENVPDLESPHACVIFTIIVVYLFAFCRSHARRLGGPAKEARIEPDHGPWWDALHPGYYAEQLSAHPGWAVRYKSTHNQGLSLFFLK